MDYKPGLITWAYIRGFLANFSFLWQIGIGPKVGAGLIIEVGLYARTYGNNLNRKIDFFSSIDVKFSREKNIVLDKDRLIVALHTLLIRNRFIRNYYSIFF